MGQAIVNDDVPTVRRMLQEQAERKRQQELERARRIVKQSKSYSMRIETNKYIFITGKT